ncbi:RNA repair domain-containing protein [Streptomyces sp. BI20]|uniref:RNA repair domain-containing protein n=1 Tax=Streptomyces sp. BI20 TaxID=3403460 RepID=UPI003C71C88C
MRTSEEVYHRIRWDARLDQGRFVFGVAQRGAEPERVPFARFVPGGDVPWHRVLFVEADGVVVWDRASGVDTVGAEGPGRVRAERALAAPFFAPRVPHRWDPAAGEWAPAVPDPAPVAGGSGGSGGSLRVLTWNTLWDRYDAELISTARRRALLPAALAASGADVIALQEVEEPLWRALLAEPWLRAGWTVSDGPRGREVSDTGLAVLSRVPITEVGTHSLGRHKAVLGVRLAAPSGPWTVLCTHLSSDHTQGGGEVRAVQLGRIAQGLAGLDPAVPALVVGDFNDGRIGAEGPAGVLGVADAWSRRHGPEDLTPTFDPGVNPLAAVGSLTGQAGRIDRVLLRGDRARVLAARRYGDRPATPDGLFLSDHFGVLVDLAADPEAGGDGPRDPAVAGWTARPTTAEAPDDEAERAVDERVTALVRAALGPGSVLEVVGSRRWGCALPGADLDLVGVPGDPALSPGTIAERLRASGPEVSRVREVVGARVPGLRLRCAGRAVDLVVATVPGAPAARALARRAEGGAATAAALGAVDDAVAVTTAVTEAGVAEEFRALARTVKGWARARGLDGAPFGGLPGIAWTVLAAHTALRLGPGVSREHAWTEFFGQWAVWDWGLRVGAPGAPGGPAAGPARAGDGAMAVLTPTAPVRSTGDRVTPAGREAITEELYRAWEAAAGGAGPERWAGPPPLYRRHAAWALVTVAGEDAEGVADRLRGRMWALRSALEEAGHGDAHPWPRPCAVGPGRVRYAVGLGSRPPGEAALAALALDPLRGLPGVSVRWVAGAGMEAAYRLGP